MPEQENENLMQPTDTEEQRLIKRYNLKSQQQYNVKYFPWTEIETEEDSGARSEWFCSSIALFCCPRLTWFSFIVIISIIEVIIYIVSLCIYGLDDSAFLAPAPQSLAIMGMADAKSTKNDYQFYRWIMPMFLHGHLEHIAGNVAFQLFLGSGIEYGIGWWRMAILYTFCGIGGVLFTNVFTPQDVAVGASCSGYGLLGFGLSYVITNWTYMQINRPFQRWFLLAISLFFFFLNMGFHFRASYFESENLGHQGGYITGIFIGLAISEQFDYNATSADPPRAPDRFTEEAYAKQSSCRKISCARIGLILTILWFLTLILLFYLFTDVDVEQNI